MKAIRKTDWFLRYAYTYLTERTDELMIRGFNKNDAERKAFFEIMGMNEREVKDLFDGWIKKQRTTK